MSTWKVAVIVALVFGIVAERGVAATIVKANNTTNLDQPGSWGGAGGPPGSSDVAKWDSTVTSANTTALGSSLNWAGMLLLGTGGNITISAGNTLTLGASGIDMTAATKTLALNCTIALSTSQTWSVISTKSITLDTATNNTLNGCALTLKGGNGSTFKKSFTGTPGSLTVLDGPLLFNGAATFTSFTVSNTTYTLSGAGSGMTITGHTVVNNGTINFGARPTWNSYDVTLSGTSQVAVGSSPTGNDTAATIGAGGFTINQPAAGATTPIQWLYVSGSYKAILTLNGDLTFAANVANTNSALVAVNPPTGTAGDGYFTWSGSRNFNIGKGGAAVDLTIQPRLFGTGALVKTGLGTLELQGIGANTYSGGTTVSNGTLFIANTNGSATGSGTVAIKDGATLGGTGTASGAVTVENGGALAPGRTGAGTLAIGALTLNNTSALKFELGSPWQYNGGNLPSPNDLLRVNGDLTLDGQLTVTAFAGWGLGTYTLLTYTGNLTDNTLQPLTLPGGHKGTIRIDTVNKAVNLVVSNAAPPGTVELVH